MHPWIAANLILRPAYLLLGEPVATFLSTFDATQWLSPQELHARQLSRLRALLRHAHQHVPYYRRQLTERGIGVDDIDSLGRLSEMPVLTKEDIRRHADDLKSATAHIHKTTRKTSGSTGQPLRLQKDRTATGAMNAVMWRNYRWFGIALGDRQARLWAGPVNRLQRWTLRVSDGLQNRVRLSPFALTPGRLEAFMGTIASFKPHYIYGYGQSLYRLAAYVLDHHLDLGDVRPKAVITTAERLFDHQRKAIATAFGAPVVDEYGCTEAGVIAMQCPQGRLHVMADHLLIETVRDGRAVGPGQEGDILITELYGSLMPLIRYKVGDRGILSKESCPCGRGLPVLAKFTGRTTDHIVCPGGTVIDPDIVDFFLKARRPLYEAVRQWHVQQISQSKLLITLCTRGAQSQIEVASYLEEMFRTVSRDLEIQFQYEDWLGPETSGKTRIFTNLSLTSP